MTGKVWIIKDTTTESAAVLSMERGEVRVTVTQFADDVTFEIIVDGQDGINVPIGALRPLRELLRMLEG